MSEVTQTTSSTPSEYALSGRGLLASAWWMTGSHLVAQSFAYLSLILLARWLPPASFGTVAVGTAIVYFAVLFVDRGTIGAIIVAPRLDRADLVRAFRRCMLRALVLAAAMAATASVVVDRFATGGDAAAVAALALCLPLQAIAIVPTALLQKSMQFRRLAGVTATANIVSATAAIAMALADFGVWALVARQLVLFAMMAGLASALCIAAFRADGLVFETTNPPDRYANAARWFFVFELIFVVTINLDALVVGAFGDASVVGLYALAFTIAMAPTTHFSEQVGKVLMAATASRPESCGERVEKSVRLMAMLLMPMMAVGILAAPAVLPALLGAEWEPIVVPFQMLLVVGVGHAMINCVGAALSGNGHIAFRTKLLAVRSVATLSLLLILVPANGIRGAALAQLLVFIPYAAVYFSAGARRAGTSVLALGHALRLPAVAVTLQVAAVLAVVAAAGTSDSTLLTAAAVAAITGAVIFVPALLRILARVRSS